MTDWINKIAKACCKLLELVEKSGMTVTQLPPNEVARLRTRIPPEARSA